ncbi:hypothetical protein ElyMa_005490000 [Elysia marginata]|uniref:Uncharacterized protein n=1 Tax=Elysia marginata TaxID=1093978 RepID=A0AAV4ERG4_9GAST|nr:hypothetical protein ElyMa_005490000 [Elysia marginata]
MEVRQGLHDVSARHSRDGRSFNMFHGSVTTREHHRAARTTTSPLIHAGSCCCCNAMPFRQPLCQVHTTPPPTRPFFYIIRLCGLAERPSLRDREVRGSIPGRVKPRIIFGISS